ncbi:hypothetical protein [Thermus sp.]|uniref:hypothetical protein n=1 Tax=Thermus sp. TaxID=275 RepID=UPI00261D9B13|nr:hypothetical protein [Thermus sp.]MCX7850743.1 hypothetical protein [Thermus sp.]
MPEAKIVRMQELEAPTGARIPVAWLDLGGRREVAVPLARLAEAIDYDLEAIRFLSLGKGKSTTALELGWLKNGGFPEKAHPDPSPEPLLREVARLLRQQTEALTALLRRLGA